MCMHIIYVYNDNMYFSSSDRLYAIVPIGRPARLPFADYTHTL